MNAQDTIMTKADKLGCSLRGKYPYEEIKDVILDTATRQAEITWEAAIKEVERCFYELLQEWLPNASKT